MQCIVKTAFKSIDGIRYRPGDIFIMSDLQRAKKLQKRGLIGLVISAKQPETLEKQAESTEKVSIVSQKPGGWYELSDGRNVRKIDLPEYLQS